MARPASNPARTATPQKPNPQVEAQVWDIVLVKSLDDIFPVSNAKIVVEEVFGRMDADVKKWPEEIQQYAFATSLARGMKL